MGGRFSVEKILQEIGYLLSLNGGRVNLFELMKELYLIDSESIAERDSSISGDSYFIQ
ncbi:MAG: SocA family protein [Holosporaceae bacterium]|nr:SocA family protein [Holosporaceae bacterium]